MLLASLPGQWRQRATDLARYSPFAAEAFNEAADQLEQALQSAEESVSLREASALGGYSVDHLQRLVASGRLENVGRKGKPRVRRSLVPLKPGHVFLLTGQPGPYVEPTAVVASVTARGKHP